MKPIYIILIIAAAVGIAAIVGAMGNSMSYVSFKEAIEISKSNADKEVHVVCNLVKGSIVYEPTKNANHLEFYAKDSINKQEMKVIYSQPKPPDMERSEKLVIVGKYNKDHFAASQILSKCPSKYEDSPINTSKTK